MAVIGPDGSRANFSDKNSVVHDTAETAVELSMAPTTTTTTTTTASPSLIASPQQREWVLDEMNRELFLVTSALTVSDSSSSISKTESGITGVETVPLPVIPSFPPHHQQSTTNENQDTCSTWNHYYSGMIITWISPAGLIPDQKRIMMALSPTNATTQILCHTGRAAIHLLSSSQLSMAAHFGTGHMITHNKFEHGQLLASSSSLGTSVNSTNSLFTYEIQHDVPIIHGTMGYIIVQVVACMNVGDRIIVVADVIHEAMNDISTESNHSAILVRDLIGSNNVSLIQSVQSNKLAELQQEYVTHIDRDRQLRALFYSPPENESA
jgi:flavin reductase (DIM6/NTAB) family NADH-FMN oxidoreductase RutF